MSAELIKQSIEWVDTNALLEKTCAGWENKSLLAVDTEFMRSDTYYPITGLIQINDGEKNYLIDPKPIDDFFPLVEIVDSKSILKVFHSCSEDLEVFHRTIGTMPNGLFDTQIAGAMAGYGFSVGFANMVKSALDISLPKTETRSDWLARPLSQHQISYAAMDVEYLFLLAEHLIESLKEKGRFEWALEESQSLVNRYFDNQDPEASYLRVKSAWKLNSRQLAVLKALAKWREDYAQENDQPRNRILKEHTVFEIAKLMPKHTSQLRGIEGISERMIRNNGNKIVSIVKVVMDLDENELPETIPRPLGSEAKHILKPLKSFVSNIAQQLGIPPELFLKKKDYEFFAVSILNRRDLSLPENLNGWRKAVMGDLIIDFLHREFNEND